MLDGSLTAKERMGTGGDKTLNLGRTVHEFGVQVHVNRTSLYLGPVHGEGAGAWRYAYGVGQGGVETRERIVPACPNGRCGERIVLVGSDDLWYGRGRPEAFSCEGCGGRLTLATRIVAGKGRGRR